MRDKTRNLILKILQGGKEIESGAIQRKLEEKEDYRITYDTLSKNLKLMFEEGTINRYAKGKELNKNTGRKHWNYYYSLKN